MDEATRAVHQMNYGGMPLRVIMIDDQPWFAAVDVCATLGISNASQATAKLCSTEFSRKKLSTAQRARPNNVVNEAGLYRLIFQSRKPEAKAFQDWVTRDVLPSILKTGSACPLRPTQGPLQGGLTVLLKVGRLDGDPRSGGLSESLRAYFVA